MGAIEFACLALAALILASNQAIKDAPAFRDRFGTPPGWVNYLPLVLVLIGGGLWAARQFASILPPTTVSAGPVVETTSPNPVAPLPPISTDYVPEAVASKFLSLYKSDDPTPLQEDFLLEPYAGKRMRFSGLLDSVTMEQDGSLTVQLSANREGGGSFFVLFPKKWTSQLSELGPHSPLNVDALITRGQPAHLTDGALF